MNRAIGSLSLILGATLAVCGCRKKEELPAPTPGSPPGTNAVSSGNPITAPVDYLGAIAKAKKAAEKTIDTVAINSAIQQFNVQEGRYPKDLDELVAQKYLISVPAPPYGMKIEYDAVQGKVKIVPQ